MIEWLRWYREHLRQARSAYLDRQALLERFPSARIEPDVSVVSPHLLELGEGVLIQRGSLLHCGGRAWSHGKGHIRLGAHTTISHHSVLFGAGGLVTGERFGCGPGCLLFSSRDDYEAPAASRGHVLAPLVFEDDVLLYAGVIVGPGVTVGRGSVVGAGSVVLDDVPPGVLAAGSPARVIRAL